MTSTSTLRRPCEDKLTELVDGGANQIMDLTGTEFLDSFALGKLVGANDQIEAADGRLQIVCTKPQLLRVLQITRLSEVIAIFDSVVANQDLPS